MNWLVNQGLIARDKPGQSSSAQSIFVKPGDGPLSDSSLDSGEQVGMMELFAGAIGTFKSPSSHRQVDYDDPTEASEVVLLADLLMRILDRL